MDYTSIIYGALGGGAITSILGLIAYTYRESIRALLEKTLRKDVEKFKQSLEEKTEHLKHDLHKEMLHAQLATDRLHKTYAEMASLITQAVDYIDSLINAEIGASYSMDYSKEDPEQIRVLLDPIFAAQSEKDSILATFRADSNDGNRRINELMKKAPNSRSQ